MICPDCGIELKITKSRYVFENDDTPDKETKVFMEQDLECRNPQCRNYKQIVETERHEMN